MATDIELVLNHVYDRWDLGECTIRNYLVELAQRVWAENEGFSGKRPFGNSGWKYDVYYALADGGFINAPKDDDGEFDLDGAAIAEGNAIIEAAFVRLRAAMPLLKQIEKIKHFATGDCDMAKDIRLRCIARICQAVEFDEASAVQAERKSDEQSS